MRKKAVILAPLPPPAGGIAIWADKMKKIELKDDWYVSIVDEKVIDGRQVFGDKTKKQIYSEIKRTYNIWKNLIKELRDKDTTVVHSCIPASFTSMLREYVCAILTKLFNKKFIIHFRCTVPNMIKDRKTVFMLKRLCKISNYIIVLNSASYKYILSITTTQTSIVPNFIDDNELFLERKINSKIKKVIYVGGVVEEKGCMEIIEISKKFPDITFELIGNCSSKIKDMAANIKNVILTGQVSKEIINKKLKEADVFIFLSHYMGEGFSNALVEAMAMGLPCIVTDWAANKDMIENKGGYVVNIGDIKAEEMALENLYNKSIREKMSKWNIEKVKKNYSSKIVTDSYVDIYENVCNK